MLVVLCYVLMVDVHGPRLGRSQTSVADCRRNDALTPSSPRWSRV